MGRKVKALLLVLVGMLLLSACYSVPADMVAVEVEESPTKAKKVLDCKPPASRGFWTNNDYRLFPNNERDWDATGQKDSDRDPYEVVTRDSVEMLVPMTVRFTLKTECETLKEFYTKYARRYGVEFDEDGNYNNAWVTTLRKLVSDPAQATLDRVVQGYAWRQVWNDPKSRSEIEKAVTDNIQGLLQQQARGEYFENVTVVIGKPRPASKELAEAVALEQKNVAKAQSAEAQARADVAKAEAETAVARAEAEKKRAEVAGFGGVENYLRYTCMIKAAEAGSVCNPYQPTYLVGAAK